MSFPGMGAGGRATGASDPSEAFSILFVCTGNICRSAFAERLAAARLAIPLGSDPSAVRLSSAGTRAVVGSGMDPDTAAVLRDHGGDPAGFSARQLDEVIVGSADLVLTLTRDHRRQALLLNPRGLARTFTLREAGDLVARVQAAPHLPGTDVQQRTRALVRAMAEARGRRAGGPGDDVPDPFGQRLEVHRRVAEQIDEALQPLLDMIAAPTASGDAPVATGC